MNSTYSFKHARPKQVLDHVQPAVDDLLPYPVQYETTAQSIKISGINPADTHKVEALVMDIVCKLEQRARAIPTETAQALVKQAKRTQKSTFSIPEMLGAIVKAYHNDKEIFLHNIDFLITEAEQALAANNDTTITEISRNALEACITEDGATAHKSLRNATKRLQAINKIAQNAHQHIGRIHTDKETAKPAVILAAVPAPNRAMKPPYHLKRIGNELYIENMAGMVCDMQLSEVPADHQKAEVEATAQFIVNACNAARVEPI